MIVPFLVTGVGKAFKRDQSHPIESSELVVGVVVGLSSLLELVLKDKSVSNTAARLPFHHSNSK